MPRFFKENFENEPFIDGADASHIVRSLRMRIGEKLTVCDGTGYDYICSIISAEADKVTLNIDERQISLSEPDINVTVCPCLMKGDKMEQVIKHCVELGAFSFIPLCSDNCVSRPNKKSAKAKILRHNKIASEAAGQSGRGIIPKVEDIISLDSFIKNRFDDFDMVLFFYELGGEPLGQTFWDNDKAKKIAIITGPEGGFSKDEAKKLKECGAKTISLGKRILRAETAPLAALTGVMLLTDNLE